MALGNTVRIAVAHQQSGSNNRPWYTTYQLVSDDVAELTYSQAQGIMEDLINAEADLYYNTVTITGATTSRYQIKTTVPDPTPPPYVPEDHTTAVANIVGTRGTPTGEQLFYDQVLDFKRSAAYGNPGHIELRGALTEGEVQQALSSKVLATGSVPAWQARLTAFAADLATIETTYAVLWVMVTQPQTSIVRTVVDNKVRTTRTYGATNTRQITGWSLGQVRTDKGHAKYFDTAL